MPKNHRCDALDPITQKTSKNELIDRLIEQIRMVDNDSIRYEIETIMEYLLPKIEDKP